MVCPGKLRVPSTQRSVVSKGRSIIHHFGAHDLIHMDEVKNFNWLFYDNHILCTLTLKYRYGHKYQDVGVCHEIVFNN